MLGWNGAASSGSAPDDTQSAANGGGFGTSSAGRFVSAQIGNNSTVIAGRMSLATLLALSVGAIAFYVWSRNSQGGG